MYNGKHMGEVPTHSQFLSVDYPITASEEEMRWNIAMARDAPVATGVPYGARGSCGI